MADYQLAGSWQKVLLLIHCFRTGLKLMHLLRQMLKSGFCYGMLKFMVSMVNVKDLSPLTNIDKDG